MSFSQNSIYLRVRLRERFVNPQLLKQLAVYKIKEEVFWLEITLVLYNSEDVSSKASRNVLSEKIWLIRIILAAIHTIINFL